MARFDKYNLVGGGFRARIGWAPVATEVGDVIAVSVNGSGQLVKTTAATDVCEGVVCLSSLVAQGDVVDCMSAGEIVDVGASDNVTGAAAGAVAYAAASGGVGVTAPGAGVNGTKIGRFIEAWRLVVRVNRVQG